MKEQPVKIEIYDKRERSTTTMYVERLAKSRFRMLDNDLFNCKLTLGTEFETRLNKDGKHEIIKISKESEFITRRFLLSMEYRNSDYAMLGQELSQRGGFWQVDMGGIATINIPKDFEFDVDEVMKSLDLKLTEIVED